MLRKPFILCLLLISSLSLRSQNRPITIDDMANWEYIKSHELSTSGNILGYVIASEAGDPRVCFYTKSNGHTRCHERSDKIQISANEEWAIVTSSPSVLVLDSLKRKKTKKEDLPGDTLKILHWASDKTTSIAHVGKTLLIDSMPNILIYQLDQLPEQEVDSTKAKVKKLNDENGYPVIIRHVISEAEDTLHYVTSWHVVEDGPTIAAVTTGKDSSDASGIVMYDINERQSTLVRETDGKVTQISSTKTGDQFVFIIDEDTTKAYQRPHQLWHWEQGQTSLKKLTDGSTADLLPESRIKETYTPQFTEDGQNLFFGYNIPLPVQDTNKLEKEVIDVEVWSTTDPLLYTMQNTRIEDAKKKTFHALLDLSSGAYRAVTDTFTDHLITNKERQGSYAVVYHNETYLPHIVFEAHDYKDLYGLNLLTGEKWLIEKAVHGNPELSPSGELLIWHNPSKGEWRCHDLASRTNYTWTNDAYAEFEDEEHDHPRPPYAYGLAGLTEEEDHVYIYDRYDIWRFETRANLSGTKLTNGRSEQLEHRIIQLDKEAEYLSTGRQLVYLRSDKTKGSHYAWMDLKSGEISNSGVLEKRFDRRPTLSQDSSTIVYTVEDYHTFPDLKIGELKNWEDAKTVTGLQQQSEGFAWGDISHVQWGAHEGMLVVPEDFDPGKKYPLIVNFYEQSSNGLYKYRRPYLHRSTINYPHYASRGYVIFNPDIIYTIGDPGKSALDIVESGVRHLIDQGFIDKERVALQGHSWGGYQIAHIVTKSDLFTCAESGAPVVNMTSAYGGIRWGSGMSRMFQYEQTQSRLGKTLWEDPDVYLRNSPLFNVDKVDIPILILHNDEDQAVPWYQGIEFFMALRRLNKRAWMLNYRGEPHWPVKFENRTDFQTRMMQFFDHYMLDKTMPVWMREGIPAHLRGVEDGLD